MMLENHLRHNKPSELNPSVVWGGRIGLLLLVTVTLLTIIPLVAEQIQLMLANTI